MKKKTKTIKPDKFELMLLPVITDLTANGKSQADIGVMLGFAGKDPKGWFERLRKNYSDIDRAWEAGKNAADTHLVMKAFQRAVGYDIVSEEIKYEYKDNKWIPVEKKTTPRHIPAETSLLKFFMINRLPEFFKKANELNKNQSPLNGDIRSEILAFVGKLADVVQDTKFVDSESKE